MRAFVPIAGVTLLIGCQSGGSTEPGNTRPGPTTTGTSTGGTVTDTTDTGSTTTSLPTIPDYDCSQPLPAAPVDNFEVAVSTTAEDFDLDINGYVGFVDVTTQIIRDLYGDMQVISPGLDLWVTGNRVLSTGDWVAMQPAISTVVRLDAVTGDKTVIDGSMSFPNGLEVGQGDILYMTDYTDGNVWMVDAWDPTDRTLLASGLSLPNGIALSPDEQTLYIGEDLNARILTFERTKSGAWTQGDVLIDTADMYQGMTVDICGNIYVIRTLAAEAAIVRITPDGLQSDVMTIMPAWLTTNIRFGSGVGGWDATTIYVTDREAGTLRSLQVGIPGKKHIQLP